MINKTPSYTIASASKRFLNLLIDTIFMFVPSVIIDAFIYPYMDGGIGLVIFINFCIYSSYYIILEENYGKTIAKFITGTKVIAKNGDKLNHENLLLRTICRLIPLEVLSFLSSYPVGWHDSLSNSRVINDETVASNIIDRKNKVINNVQQEIEKLIKEEERYRENIKILNINDEEEKKKRSEFVRKIVEIENQIDNLKKIINEDLKKVESAKQNTEANRDEYKTNLKYDRTVEIQWYNLGCFYAIRGSRAEALKNLAEAIKLDAKFKDIAKNDNDFKTLWNDEEFNKLVN